MVWFLPMTDSMRKVNKLHCLLLLHRPIGIWYVFLRLINIFLPFSLFVNITFFIFFKGQILSSLGTLFCVWTTQHFFFRSQWTICHFWNQINIFWHYWLLLLNLEIFNGFFKKTIRILEFDWLINIFLPFFSLFLLT